VTDRRHRVSYSVIDVKDFEGRRTPVAQALGAAAIKANQFDSQADQVGHEHDELKSGQEELYVPLRGTGCRSTARRLSSSRGATCLWGRPHGAGWTPGLRVSRIS
jgi:hypothetical protein